MRSEYLPFTLPDIDENEIAEVNTVLRSGWLTTGNKTRLFEEKFAEKVGAKFAVAVNSGTAAMHLALEAIGIKPGDEVITSPYTFAATAEVIRYFNARPVFIDIDSNTLNIKPDFIEKGITERTKAIVPVHIGGLSADLDSIHEVAKTYNLSVIEDAAHALLTKYKDRMIGSLSDFTCFSFYATKPITTGEGGMICTDNEAWAKRCQIMALHGISQDAWKRYSREGSWYYEIVAPGYKYNLTDIAAAIGLVQLSKTDWMLKRRKEIADQYTHTFQEFPELQIPFNRIDSQHSWHLYMLRLNLDRLRIDRSRFIKELHARKIGTSVHFIPLHLHPYYQKTYGYQPQDFPMAYSEYQREISLPIYSKMNDRDVQYVIEAIADVIKEYKNS